MNRARWTSSEVRREPLLGGSPRRSAVRVYTGEKDRAVLLLVDQRQNMFFGSRDRLKSVTAAERLTLSDGTLQMEVDLADPSVDSRVAADFRAAATELARCLAAGESFKEARTLGTGLKKARSRHRRSRRRRQKAASVLPELNGPPPAAP